MSLSRAVYALAAALLLAAVALELTPSPDAGVGAARTPGMPARRAVALSTAPNDTSNEISRPPRRSNAWRAARAFLDDYLAVSHGHAPPRAIRAATAGLRARFERNPPHLGEEASTREPRVLSLREQQTRARLTVSVATVSDGEVDYPVTLRLAHTRHGWLVTDVGAS